MAWVALVLIQHRWPSIAFLHDADLFVIPSGAVVTAFIFGGLRLLRRRNRARRLREMSYARARDIAFAALGRTRTALEDETLRREADLIRSHWPRV